MLPRLLFLTHRFPYPPNRGDRIRSYNMLRELGRHHRVTLACTTDEAVASSDLEHVNQLCESVFVAPLHRLRRLVRAAGSVAKGRSLTEGMFYSPSLSAQIDRAQQKHPFDNLLVFCSSMFPYVDGGNFAGTPTVVDLVDVDSQKWKQMSRESTVPKRWVYRLEASRVHKLEQRIADRARAVTLVSDCEADVFRRTLANADPDLAIRGISNGVDTAYFQPLPNTNADAPSTDPRSDARQSVDINHSASPPHTSNALRLVFTGVLDYRPNVEGIDWFCRQVMPALRQQIAVELSIVGRRPTPRILELSKLAGVHVVGEVPDVRPYLHRADVAISPLSLARGIQNKVLEAMAAGLPVVLTGPSAEGIAAESGRHFVIADSATEWTEQLVALARDPQSRASIGGAARELVVEEYSWPAKLSGFQALLHTSETDGPRSRSRQTLDPTAAPIQSPGNIDLITDI